MREACRHHHPCSHGPKTHGNPGTYGSPSTGGIGGQAEHRERHRNQGKGGARAEQGHEHEASAECPHDAAGGAYRIEASDDWAGIVEVARGHQLMGHQWAGGTEEDARQEPAGRHQHHETHERRQSHREVVNREHLGDSGDGKCPGG